MNTGVGKASFVLCMSIILSGWLARVCPAADHQAEMIILQQHVNLSSIAALKLNSKLRVKLSEERSARLKDRLQGSDSVFNYLSFTAKGDKFRSEVGWSAVDGQTNVSKIWAYDGDNYQSLRSVDRKKSLAVSSLPFTSDPYGTSHPLLLVYAFAFEEGDMRTITHLQKQATWQRLLNRIVSSEDTEKLGHAGVTLKFSGKYSYEVFFASDLGHYPLYWRLSYPDGRVSECQSTSTRTFAIGDNNVVLPLAVFGRESKDNALRCETTLEIEPDTLEVNPTVGDDVFTISKEQAEYFVDSDTGLPY